MKLLSMKRATAIAALGAMICSVPAHAQNYAATGTVTRLFNFTLRDPTSTAKGVTMIQLSTPLEGGCVWGFLEAADKNALAIVLAAKAAGSTITLSYDNTAYAPWGGGTNVCAVMGVEVN